MKLIVGLGNPGEVYAHSRHNIGFTVVKALARKYKAVFKKDFGISSLSAKAKITGQNIALALPLTFMNLSGSAVSRLLKKYKVGIESLLVVCDDLDLKFGRLKLRPSGSSAGHRGIQSIIDSLKCEEFARLRLGIGRPPHQLQNSVSQTSNWCGGRPNKGIETADYVLAEFSKKEKTQVRETIEKARGCCESWATKGTIQAMNIYNKEERKDGRE